MTGRVQAAATARRPPLPRRVGPAAGLFLLAPVTAEYLIGYDESVGRPLELLGGLLILGPLYGGAALIVREVTRRAGRGWPTMILLASAFGVLQAGLVDQSLFNTSFRDIDSWDEMVRPTFVPALGIGAGPRCRSSPGTRSGASARRSPSSSPSSRTGGRHRGWAGPD